MGDAQDEEPKEDYEGHQEGKECHRLRVNCLLKRERAQPAVFTTRINRNHHTP